MSRHVFGFVMVLVFAAASYAQQAAPAAAPGKLLEKQPYVLSPAQVQEYPEQDYFYITTDATQKTMPEVMRKLRPHLAEAARAAGLVAPSGPVVVVYHGLSADPNAKFEVEAGFIVQQPVKASDSAQVRKLEPFKCASMLYTGLTDHMAEAYGKMFATMGVSGVMPTMEMRQMVLYWESETSPNNIMLIQVGIQ